MPALARKASKPTSRQAKAAANRRQPQRPSTPYAPAKLEAARGLGVAPTAAVSIAALMVAAGLAAALFSGDRLQTVGDGASGLFGGALAGLGLQVAHIHVQGASTASRPLILRAAGAEEGDSILGLDLQRMRQRVERVGWVEDAKIIRLLPDTLVIAVKERRPVAVWQNRGRIGLIDAQGKPIAGADAGAFTRLPLVVGEGANDGVAEILPLLSARPRLMSQTEALVRVDRRRWDLRLKDGGLIQLPALDVDAALIQLDQLDQRARVLALGFAKIDLRDPEMIAVRPRDSQSTYQAQIPSALPAAVQAHAAYPPQSPSAGVAERAPAVL